MTALLEAARDVLDWLDRRSWRSCLIGGLAVQRWGEPRLTNDADVTVLVDLGLEERFIDEVLREFAPRRPDARVFALRYRVLLVETAGGAPLDLALGTTGFECETLERASTWTVQPGLTLFTCSAEDLVVHKSVAARPRDIADIEGIVIRQFDRLDVGLVRRWLTAFSDVAENPDIGRPFEVALARERRRREAQGTT